MKIIMVDQKGNESLVCESIGEYHGLIIVSLLNGNYSSKARKVVYKLVEMDHIVDKVTCE